jgi:2-polyprenyl-6-methoxyphenol hydroxylase-like FAD-dependent oxidoreductase
VEFVGAAEVTGLCAESAGRRITGVRLRGRGGAEAAEAITADFVVDATGRASRAPEWLTALGYITPNETLVDGHLGYASRIFARDPDARLPWRAVFSQAALPGVTPAGLAFPIERERWIVTLAGRCGDYPPADAEGFAEFARSLPCSEVFRIVTSSVPLSPIRCFRATQNRLHHYERIPLPEGFAILGDAVCAFNPVYGQGMSAAAIGTKILDGCLVRGRLHNFQQDLAKALSTPWTFATSEDARYPGTEGIVLSSGTRATHWYLDRVIARSVQKEEVRTALLSVMHMARGVTALFRPWIALPILFGALAGKMRGLRPRFSQRQVFGDA